MSLLIPHLPASLQALFSRHQKLSLASAGTLLFVAVVGMGIISLAMLNGKAMNGYTLNELERERQQLVEDGEITDMLSLRARSLVVIQQASIGMIKPLPTEITYVLPVTVVAKTDSEFGY